HEAAKAAIADENICAEPEHEIRHGELASGGDRGSQFVAGVRLIKQVGGPADFEGRVRRKYGIARDAPVAKSVVDCLASRRRCHRQQRKRASTNVATHAEPQLARRLLATLQRLRLSYFVNKFTIVTLAA